MSETPRSPHPDEPQEPDFAKMFEQLLGDTNNPAMKDALASMGIADADPAVLGQMAQQLSAMFTAAPTDGMNLELSGDVARKTVAAAGDTVVDATQRKAVSDAVGVAGLWLDEATEFSTPLRPLAWSRAEWVEATMQVWGDLVGPVAQGVNNAIVAALRSQLEQLGSEGMQLPGMPPIPGLASGMDAGSMLGSLEPMLGRMSSSMFGAQIGQAVGSLAGDVVSGTEVGLPLLGRGDVALLPANVTAFAEGLEVDRAQVEIYLAAREAARVRLFADVPWLGPQLLTAVQEYARDITIDTDGIEAKISGIDVSDPNAVQMALRDGLFSPTPSAAQKAALGRLETLLALVEGWVDVVADRATVPHLPQAGALGEAVRRRRATGGPAEHLFGQLVGLELRPRRLRDAANLFAALENAGGPAARDGAWAHPDVAPTAADLDDVLGYVERRAGGNAAGVDDMDAALAQLIDEAATASGDGGPGPAASTTTDTGPESGAPGAESEDRGHDDEPGRS